MSQWPSQNCVVTFNVFNTIWLLCTQVASTLPETMEVEHRPLEDHEILYKRCKCGLLSFHDCLREGMCMHLGVLVPAGVTRPKQIDRWLKLVACPVSWGLNS